MDHLFRGTQEKGGEEGAGRFPQRCFLKQVPVETQAVHWLEGRPSQSVLYGRQAGISQLPQPTWEKRDVGAEA